MIYLDHAAATPLDPVVFKKMEPFLNESYGNASSIHSQGRAARAAIEEARAVVAEHLGANPGEIIFTSGGTEANNWAIFGLAEGNKERGNHVITSVIEHESILEPCKQLERRGFKVRSVPVDSRGVIDPAGVGKAVTPKTVFASLMYANNEIGVVQDICALSRVLKKKNILFHTDACQATGYLPMDVQKLGVDALTLNSGKIYGPKGAGALYVRGKTRITPLLFGGGQEFRMRAGTENVAAIVGFAEALKLSFQRKEKETAQIKKLTEAFIRELLNIRGVQLNGDRRSRLPNNINVSVEGVSAESLLVRLDMEHIAASAGSACSSGASEPSHVLKAIGLSDKEVRSGIRFSLGRRTTAAEIEQTVAAIKDIIEELRSLRPPQKIHTKRVPKSRG
ncbi:MAG TPA: cysteine desulfurase family protein [Candidatus Gracilibacteria bacterium]|nr:cysteine desulfurase family protein [Candidatus Gracilibacteria bacterium]